MIRQCEACDGRRPIPKLHRVKAHKTASSCQSGCPWRRAEEEEIWPVWRIYSLLWSYLSVGLYCKCKYMRIVSFRHHFRQVQVQLPIYYSQPLDRLDIYIHAVLMRKDLICVGKLNTFCTTLPPLLVLVWHLNDYPLQRKVSRRDISFIPNSQYISILSARWPKSDYSFGCFSRSRK